MIKPSDEANEVDGHFGLKKQLDYHHLCNWKAINFIIEQQETKLEAMAQRIPAPSVLQLMLSGNVTFEHKLSHLIQLIKGNIYQHPHKEFPKFTTNVLVSQKAKFLFVYCVHPLNF